MYKVYSHCKNNSCGKNRSKLHSSHFRSCVKTIMTIIQLQKQLSSKVSRDCNVHQLVRGGEEKVRGRDGMKLAAPYGPEVDGAQQPTFKQQSDQFHSNTRHFCLKCRHRYLDFSLVRLLEVCRDCLYVLSWKVRLCYVSISAGDFQATSKQVFPLLIKCKFVSLCCARHAAVANVCRSFSFVMLLVYLNILNNIRFQNDFTL